MIVTNETRLILSTLAAAFVFLAGMLCIFADMPFIGASLVACADVMALTSLLKS